MTRVIDPSDIAKTYRSEIRSRLASLKAPLKLVGFLATDAAPSATYAKYTQTGCSDVGVHFELRRVDKLALEEAIDAANADAKVHGIIVYYPIFSGEHDRYIKDLVDHRKDVEGLNTFWAKMLYHNQRYIDPEAKKKAILPCTPLAIIKLLQAAGNGGAEKRLSGHVATIFNRSEVVGRPLASMLANDGAEVFSFDIDGALLFRNDQVVASEVTRAEALARSDIVITGIPSREFPLVSAREIQSGAICINFSTLRNFAADIEPKASVWIPRVGPMTVAMVLRNILRLFDNYHT